jgi:thymidylate synthase
MTDQNTNQDELRGTGKIPVIAVEADNLAEATHKSIIACHDQGVRVETPKHRAGGSLGYDADMIIRVNNPEDELQVYFPGIHDTSHGVMQYILEVTHGIHNHWKKTPEEPHFWGYTYNERFVDQLPFIFQRIKADWDEKKEREGTGRITGRDYQFTIWRAGEDIILEQDDPPCFQRGHFRFTKNSSGELVLTYITDWRSRDLLKAWNQNNIGQIALQKLVAAKVADMLGVPVKLGAYIDRSSSLHLYGVYIDRDGLETQIGNMKKTPYDQKSMKLDDYFAVPDNDTPESLKRLIAAQSDAEAKGHGKQQPRERLIEMGYELASFPYPEEWDTWPASWDAEPDPDKLARVQ